MVKSPIFSFWPRFRPQKCTGSMASSPFGPLVMLTGWSSVFRNTRMISPKPSVTMAR